MKMKHGQGCIQHFIRNFLETIIGWKIEYAAPMPA